MSTDEEKQGAKLDVKKQSAVVALLAYPTIGKAAASVGISEKTLCRWMQQPEFCAAYQEARNQALTQMLSLLHKATGAAVAALVRNLKCGTPSVEVRAALGVLDQTFKARELLEMEERMASIERTLEASNQIAADTTGSRGSCG